jgi:hypothetical protein
MPLTLGWPCQLGVPIGVEVVTYDAVGNSDTKRVATSVTMMDTQRPTVRALFLARQGLDYIITPYGQHLASDSLLAEVIVADNYRVDVLFFEIYPFGVSDTAVVRDSLVARNRTDFLAGSIGHRFPVRFRPEWVGTKLQFRYYGRDVQGLLSNVYTTEPGCVQIVASIVNPPTTSSTPTCIYSVGDDPITTPVPSAARASHAAAPMSEPRVRSSTAYDARPIP